MTYYDELGVGPDATIEEIRESYKRLAKLLHPDIQQDERVRHVAACQMQRLNQVYQTLNHPERRRLYDAGIQPPLMPPIRALPLPPPDRLPPMQLFAWRYRTWLTGAGGLLLLVWLLVFGMQPGSTAGSEKVATMGPVAPGNAPNAGRRATSSEGERLRAELRRLREERDRLAEERSRALSTLPDLTRSLPLVETPSISPVPELAGTVTSPAPRTAPAGLHEESRPIDSSSHSRLAGTWYYVGSPHSAERNMYAAEYIEAVVEDGKGLLQGHYRARYRIPDRTISPEVQFRFEGRKEGEIANFLWRGADGSQGEMRLKLLTPNTMELAWVASSLGQSLGLGSGKAILLRRIEP